MPNHTPIFIGHPVSPATFKKLKAIAEKETGGDVNALFVKFVKEGIERKSK